MALFNELPKSAQVSMQHYMDKKATQTLLGICSGLMADATLNDKEIAYLQTWLTENQNIANAWPGSAIASRLAEIMADGIITNDERNDLVSLLSELSGNYFHETGAATIEAPALPIDDDPSVYFKNMTFCFTGEFMYGTRANCERVVLRLGGMPIDNVTKKLDYLVIGSRISPMWANTTYGRKIEKAVEHRESGVELSIISEQQWFQAIADAARN
jgi:NAD-dependent DNA ligase